MTRANIYKSQLASLRNDYQAAKMAKAMEDAKNAIQGLGEAAKEGVKGIGDFFKSGENQQIVPMKLFLTSLCCLLSVSIGPY